MGIQDDDDIDRPGFMAVHIVLGLLYLLPVIFCVRWRLRGSYASDSPRQMFWKEVFSAMVLFASIGRCLLWLLQSFWLFYDWGMSAPRDILFHFTIIPSFIIVNLYLAILFLWIEICHSYDRIIDLRFFYSCLLTLKTAMEITTVLVDILFVPTQIIAEDRDISLPVTTSQIFLSLYVTTCYFIISMLFLYYGVRVYFRFSHMRHHRLKEVALFRVKLQTVLCWACFTTRFIIVAWSSLSSSATYTYTSVFFDISYYGCCEVLPLLLMLSIFSIGSKQRVASGEQ
eukprot:TRINITY_DN20221_c0_g1_i1.p1 TRINITY_DN20221_c0_g1~~TRINITY_DN20221_c0_g1_i1.p1  ORF type:complete len:285 (-),score=19.21 TRINITY_DN20221_c0_g1_i1:77-931(-)